MISAYKYLVNVQFEPVITPGNEGLVHHMELFHCEAPIDVQMPPYKGNCFAPDRPEATMVCKKVIAAWAMGATPFAYPEVTVTYDCLLYL